MSYEIIIGRNDKDARVYGSSASSLIGKQYITMGVTTSLGNEIMLDILRPHVVLIAGKRGSGKSYTMGVIAEALASAPSEVAENITSLIIDTMGIFWTMKSPNYKEADILKNWGEEPRAFTNVRVFVPKGYFEKLKEDNPTMIDEPFSISVSDISSTEWSDIFGFSMNSEEGVLIERAVSNLAETKKSFDIDDIIEDIKSELAQDTVKDVCIGRFESAKSWGLFEKDGTKIEDLLKPAYINVLDISLYSHSTGPFSIRALVIGLLSRKVLEIREIQRRAEEMEEMNRVVEENKKAIPLVWMFIDEVHEFLPAGGITAASPELSRLVKEGRQPGIGLVIATQQPGKLDTDIITQSDIIISQHVTAKIDIDALNQVMQSYMSSTIERYLANLPKLPGACIIMDDNSERIYPTQIKPRLTWHGGETPKSLQKPPAKPA